MKKDTLATLFVGVLSMLFMVGIYELWKGGDEPKKEETQTENTSKDDQNKEKDHLIDSLFILLNETRKTVKKLEERLESKEPAGVSRTAQTKQPVQPEPQSQNLELAARIATAIGEAKTYKARSAYKPQVHDKLLTKLYDLYDEKGLSEAQNYGLWTAIQDMHSLYIPIVIDRSKDMDVPEALAYLNEIKTMRKLGFYGDVIDAEIVKRTQAVTSETPKESKSGKPKKQEADSVKAE